MIAAFLLAAAQAGLIPPPSLGPDAHRDLAARDLSCTLLRHGAERPFELSVQLPAVPLETQRDGKAHGLRARLASDSVKALTGSFSAILASNVREVARYTVFVRGGPDARYILEFQMFDSSRRGLVTATDFNKGSPTALGAGLCIFKASDRVR